MTDKSNAKTGATDWARVIRKIAPYADAGIVAMIAAHADAEFRRFGFTNERRQAHLLAQMSVETQGFTRLEENLNYSARRMTQVWPKRFPTISAAEPFAHNPKALALKTYGGRMGNRPGTDDGWTFRGRGGIQTTGRDNVEKLATKLGVNAERCAQWLTDPDHMLECACATFVMLGGLFHADRDSADGVTGVINKHTDSYQERRDALPRCYAALRAGRTAPLRNDLLDAQQRLLALNFAPGRADGKDGPLTRSALRDFQDQHGLAVSGDLDAATKTALFDSGAEPRQVSGDRAEATVEELRADGSRTVLAADQVKAGVVNTIGSIGVAGATEVIANASETVSQARTTVDQVKSLSGALAFAADHWLQLVAVAAIGAAIYFLWRAYAQANRVQAARLDDARRGLHVGR